MEEKQLEETYSLVHGLIDSQQMVEFYVNEIELENFIENGLVSHDWGPWFMHSGPWFMHCRNNKGDFFFVDFTKFIYFQIIKTGIASKDLNANEGV